MLLTRKKDVVNMYIQFRLKKVLTVYLSPYVCRKMHRRSTEG